MNLAVWWERCSLFISCPLLPPILAYTWETYSDFVRHAKDIGAGLVAAGAVPGKTHIGIFCSTRPEWLQVAHAAFTQSMSVATVYANLGEEGLIFAIQECAIEFLFTSADLLPTVNKIAKSCPTLKYVHVPCMESCFLTCLLTGLWSSATMNRTQPRSSQPWHQSLWTSSSITVRRILCHRLHQSPTTRPSSCTRQVALVHPREWWSRIGVRSYTSLAVIARLLLMRVPL